MTTTTIKIHNERVDYRRNIKCLLGWEELDKKILKESFGILKNLIKNPVQYQGKLRKEWERN